MSANADYGVKIVESFAPPANWLPGQEVNKDVYATNTGTVAAFVKETVSGVLTINNEKAVAGDTGKPTANSKELTEEERYAVEGGAFLAYKPSGSTAKLGDQIVTRPDDQDTADVNFDFTPDVEGLYVFRRSIDVDNTKATAGGTGLDGADAARNDGYGAEVFTYDAYYFVPAKAETTTGAGDGKPAKYYKVSNLRVTEDTIADFAGDGKNTDGYVTVATGDYGFYEDVTDIAKNVALTYKKFDADDADSGVKTGQYLIATYNTGAETGVDLNADYKAAAQKLDDARHEYELAVELQTRAANASAAADNTLSTDTTALNDAKNNLINALAAQATAAQAKATAQAAYDALNIEKTKLTARKTALEQAMYGQTPGSESNYVASTSLYAQSQDIPTAYTDAHNELVTEVDAWAAGASLASGHTRLADLTYDELLQFPDPVGDDEKHEYYQKLVAQKLANEQYTKMKAEYDDVVARLNQIGADNTNPSELYTAKQALDTATSALSTADTALTNAETAYNDAYSTFRTSLANSGTATTNLDTTDARLASARTKYLAAKKAFDELDSKHYAYDDGILKIYIKLSDDVILTNDGSSNAKWQMLPAPVYNDKEAVFYYTGMLEGGETSSKLIDGIYLDKRVTQDMYKNFDFDLNVDLDSVQVTQDENGRYVATSANDHFGADDDADIDGANVVIKTPTNVNTPLVWNFDARA